MSDTEDSTVDKKDLRARLKADGPWSKDVKEELLQN